MAASDVDRWFDIETDDGVRDALISDILDEIGEFTIEAREHEAEENGAQDECNEMTASPPSLQQFYAMFRPIGESASLCNRSDVNNCLRCALQLVKKASRKSYPPALRQLLITEMLMDLS